jgi:hypothetical protein
MKKHEEEKPTTSAVSNSSETPNSVASMSPEYPKYRDALIIGVVIFMLVGVLAGGYFSVRGVDSTFREFTQKPLSLLTSLTDRYDVYKVCESFLRRNEGLFRELGPGIRFSLTEEEIFVSNGEKTMTVIFKAQGRTETRDVIFQLKEEKGEWAIQYVGFERRNGQYRTVYSK